MAEGYDLDARDERFRTPLMIAASLGRVDVMEALYENCTAEARYQMTRTVKKNDWTSLMHASKGGYLSAMSLLLSNGADVHAANKEGATAFYIAAREGHTDACSLLCTHGSDVMHVSRNRRSALHAASSAGHADTVAWLLRHGCDPLAPDSSGNTAWHEAAIAGHASVLDTLYSFAVRPEQGMVKQEEEGRAAAEDAGGTHRAGQREAAAAAVDASLMRARCCTDVVGRSALHYACMGGREVTHGTPHGQRQAEAVHATTAGVRPHSASLTCSTAEQCASLLLRWGWDPRLPDDRGATPLHYAASHGSVHTVWRLLRAGADPLAHMHADGRTPLHNAAMWGHTPVVHLLLMRIADATAGPPHGQGCGEGAAGHHNDSADSLGTGRSMEVPDTAGTPSELAERLLAAAGRASGACARLLSALSALASPGPAQGPAQPSGPQGDTDGDTPLQLAQRYGRSEASELLQLLARLCETHGS